MQKDYTVYNIPGKVQPEPAEIPVDATDVYIELNEIAEELEECRLRNC